MTSTKKKLRIFATLVAMVLVLLMMSMGIYAAQKINITNNGTLALGSSGDVLAEVSVVKKRANEADATIATKNYDRSFNEGVELQEDTIELGAIVLTKITDYVEYVITITNKFDTDTKVDVNMTTMTASDPIKLQLITANNLTQGTAYAIPKGESYVMTVRVSLDESKVSQVQKENGFTAQAFSFVLKVEKGSTTV